MKNYYSGHGDKILVGAWHGVAPGHINSQKIKEIKECGIDFIHTYFVQGDEIEAVYSLCDEYGLGYLPFDARIAGKTPYLASSPDIDEILPDEQRIAQHIERYRKHPSYFGISLMDEPSSANFPRLRKLKEIYRSHEPEACCFINLFPDYATVHQLGGETGGAEGAMGCGNYQEYLDYYVSCVDPDFISYDYYPIMEQNRVCSLMSTYLKNFEAVAHKCKERGLPFWFFIQCTGLNNLLRIPTTEEMRWQVYCALAFGMQVLQLFCYVTPQVVNGEFYYYALLDPLGKKTYLYDGIQQIISELHTFDEIYMSYQNVGVMQFNGANEGVAEQLSQPLQQFEPVENITGSYPVLVGCMEKCEKKALIITNMALPWQDTVNQIQLHLSNVSSITVYDMGEKKCLHSQNSIFPLALTKGNGVFVVLGS